MRVATDVRERHEVPDHEPVCPYDLCERLGVRVRFVDVSMEGIYSKGPPPRILLSSQRPLVRRTYNCAHEGGHHLLGHGSRLDELHDRSETAAWDDPDEIAADTVAGHLLMPMIGIRRALRLRRWSLSTMSALQYYTFACDFGVGYQTLIHHLNVGVKEISDAKAAALLKRSPKSLRAEILGRDVADALMIGSPHRAAPWIDLEVDMLLALPRGTTVPSALVAEFCETSNARVFRAISPGADHVQFEEREVPLRVMPSPFVGLARYRHLESE